jgi:PEP-CTERM motif-containing protein
MLKSIWKAQFRLLRAISLVLIFGTVSLHADPLGFSFAPLPTGGTISGPAGSTIGWGYTLTNLDPVNWLLISALNSDPFFFATPDSSIFDYPVLAPSQSLNVAYDPTNFMGLFQMSWDPSAPAGFTNTGSFTLTGQFYDADPFGGGSRVGVDQSVASQYAASVSAPVGSPVPEPSTLVLLSTGLVTVVVCCRKRKTL